ncbi:hypothetical protein D3C72_1818380 [compost metagenome]
MRRASTSGQRRPSRVCTKNWNARFRPTARITQSGVKPIHASGIQNSHMPDSGYVRLCRNAVEKFMPSDEWWVTCEAHSQRTRWLARWNQ